MTFELEIIYANLLSYYNHATESTELFLQNYKIETAFYAALSSIEYNPYDRFGCSCNRKCMQYWNLNFSEMHSLYGIYIALRDWKQNKKQGSLIITDRVNGEITNNYLLPHGELYFIFTFIFVCAVCSLIAGHEMC